MNLPFSPRAVAVSMPSRQRLDSGVTAPSAAAALSVSIGIVLFNNASGEIADLARTLRRAIARLADSRARDEARAPTAVSIRLHNNGDGAVEPTLFGQQVNVAQSPVNLGFGRAHNRLMRDAFAEGADFYLALNPDAKLHPDALVEMVAAARRSEGRALIEAAQFPEELPKLFDPLTFDTPWACGCCLLIPAAVFAAIGGFDENIFLYFEDLDLSWRALAAGFAVKYAPRALVHHSWHRARAGTNYATKRVYLDSARYVAKKWGNDALVRKVEMDIARHGWELKPLPQSMPPAPDPSVVDFSNGLRFAAERWTCPAPVPTHLVRRHEDVDDGIDVIVRFHDPQQVDRLSRCLFSLYGQSHQPIQVLLMLQGLDEAGVAAVEACVEAFDWSAPRRPPQIINVPVATTGDHRSTLWNAGVTAARSRYLGFCDFDDVVYPAGYSYLLHRLQVTGTSAVFASSLYVDCTPMHGFDFAFAKRFIPGENRYDFFAKNFCPPNSLLLDRSSIRPEDLLADPTLSKHEDYRVFAVIVANYRTDWASVGTAVAEYVHRTDGSNTVMSHRSDIASLREWGNISASTRLFFETLTAKIPVADIARMRIAESRLEQAEAKLAVLEASLSWRLTRPLRSRVVRGVRQRLRHWIRLAGHEPR